MRIWPKSFVVFVVFVVGLLASFCWLQSAAEAKARIVAVIPIRSTAELKTSAALLTRQVASKLSQEPGWDTKIVQTNGRAAGEAAASVGAEIYVMGQLLRDANGLRLVISSFKAATDERIHDMDVTLSGPSLAANADFLALLGDVTGTTPTLAQTSAKAANVDPVLVPRGTVIVVTLDNALSSYSAASREPLSYTVAQNVIVNGHIIAKSGDEASGIVLEGQQGSQGGIYGIGWKAANLRVDVESVNNFCGDTIRMHFIRSEYRRRQGIFGSHQDLEVIKGQKYLAQVAHAQKVCGELTSAAPQPLPTDAINPDDVLPLASPDDTSTPGPSDIPSPIPQQTSSPNAPTAVARYAGNIASVSKVAHLSRSTYSFTAPSGWSKLDFSSASEGISTIGAWKPNGENQNGETINLVTQDIPTGLTGEQFARLTRQNLEQAIGPDNIRAFRAELICGGSQTGWYIESAATVGFSPIIAEQIIAAGGGQSYVATYKRFKGTPENAAARNALDSLCLPSSTAT